MNPSYVEVVAALEKFYKWEHVFYLYNDPAGNQTTGYVFITFMSITEYRLYVMLFPTWTNFSLWHMKLMFCCHAGLARFEKFYNIMNLNVQTMLEIDARYLDPSLSNYYDILRTLDRKYTGSQNSKNFNEKVLILDLSTDDMTQKVLDQVCLWAHFGSLVYEFQLSKNPLIWLDSFSWLVWPKSLVWQK